MKTTSPEPPTDRLAPATPSHRYKAIIAYDGTGYVGWQIQPNGMTVQEQLETAIGAVTGETVKTHGSGRTDRGVHARKQVAHFDLVKTWTPRPLQMALNAHLPKDIRVMSVQATHSQFHARRSAIRKEYRYFIWNGDMMPPDLRHYRLHIRKTLDVHAMKKAAEFLVGRHDFASFSANPDRPVESTIRHLMALRVSRRGREIVVSAVADGFLYRMVRSLCGFLVRVGEGDTPASAAREILASGRRTARVPTAAPQGLFLWNVVYPSAIVPPHEN